MSNFKDLTGEHFGRLTVLGLDEERSKITGRKYWWCLCNCGNSTPLSIRGDALGKRTFSCGCYQKEQAAKYCKENYKRYNEYDLTGDYGIGYTSKGEEFWFDLEDYDKIKDYCWNVGNNNYLQAGDGYGSTILIHRLIFFDKYPDGNFTVDHIGHNTLDNRKHKLRVSTQKNNSRNLRLRSNNTSGATGVYWSKNKNKWCAQIMVNYKVISLGSYNNFVDAVKIRKNAEEKYFGEWSYDNSMKLYNADAPDMEEAEELIAEEQELAE